MTTQTMTLSEFLLARIAEDEALAREFIDEGPWQAWALEDRGLRRDDEYAQLTIGAARVLADVEAKRRIVEVAMPGERDDAGERGRILRILASVYADHPDYRQEWRP